MCFFGISITLRHSNFVVKHHTYIEASLVSFRPISCHVPLQNYDVSKKSAPPISRLKFGYMLSAL